MSEMASERSGTQQRNAPGWVAQLIGYK